MTTPNTSRLVVTTPSDREIQLVREFAAPRYLLFDAFSSCQHVQAWWGQAGSTMPVCEVDFRVGGKWRFVERETNGSEWAFRGEYREMPGLRLTIAEACRLWQMDSAACEAALHTLVGEGFLARTSRGAFIAMPTTSRRARMRHASRN